MRGIGTVRVLVLATALGVSPSFEQASPPDTDQRLDLFLHVLRSKRGWTNADQASPISQSDLEQVLRMVPPAKVGHGGGTPPLQSTPGAADASAADPSIYGFCYEACKTEFSVASCGTPAPGLLEAPRNMCQAIEFTSTISAMIGPEFGTGASPFVDDNKLADDKQQPAGYTFLGQFIDHDVTRTQTALVALGQLSHRAQSDVGVRAKLAAAGITPNQLTQAIANAARPGSALSANTGKLDLDSVYGVSDFTALTGIYAPWFEQRDGAYTGRFAQRHIQAPTTLGAPIDGFDYQRNADGAAEIPDPRNSENKIILQIQNLFELAHNDCMDNALRATKTPTQQDIGAAFDACHKKVVWTYETIVVTDFLTRFSADAALRRIAPNALHAYVRGTKPASTLPSPEEIRTSLYNCKPGIGNDAEIGIPHEFTVAAFRLGHTLVRDDYRLHDEVRDANGTILTGQSRPIFAAVGEPDTVGLVGSNPLQAGDVIDWSYFFDTKGVSAEYETAQPGRPVDALVSDKLFMLPGAALPPGPDVNGTDTSTERNLPRRNLMRASEQTARITGSVGLGTGEEVEAYALERIPDLFDARGGVRKLFGERLKSAGFGPNSLTSPIPLWLFILLEAEITQASQRLGELGSHIVDEFLLGSLRCDEASVLYAVREDLKGWGPTETIAKLRRYSIPDLVGYLQTRAEVDGQPIRLFSRAP
jgi:hypothetical protein